MHILRKCVTESRKASLSYSVTIFNHGGLLYLVLTYSQHVCMQVAHTLEVTIAEVFWIILPFASLAVPPLQNTAASVQVQPDEAGAQAAAT